MSTRLGASLDRGETSAHGPSANLGRGGWPSRPGRPAQFLGGALLALGVFCITYVSLSLALGGAAFGWAAYACLALAVLFVVSRLRRHGREAPVTLYWNPTRSCFHLSEDPSPLALDRVWRAPCWVTLRLRPMAGQGGTRDVVIWKSAVPPPLWNELALCIHAARRSANSHENKENP